MSEIRWFCRVVAYATTLIVGVSFLIQSTGGDVRGWKSYVGGGVLGLFSGMVARR